MAPQELRDIHLPETISWWPPATGWWLLALLIVLMIILLPRVIKLFSNKSLNKTALTEFKRIEQSFNHHQNSAQLAQEISILLRRVCISYNPRYEAASLTGKQWLDYLNKMTEQNYFSAQTGEIIFTAPYQKQPEFNSQELLDSCKNWIEHLPRRLPA